MKRAVAYLISASVTFSLGCLCSLAVSRYFQEPAPEKQVIQYSTVECKLTVY